MFYLPNPDALRSLGIVVSGTEHDQIYQQWLGTMKEYSTSITGVEPCYEFWLVVRMWGHNYSEHLVDHHILPMMVPSSGTGDLVGIARTKDELDDMITPGVDLKTGRAKPEDHRGDYVYLTYKVKLRGEESWRDLLEYLGTHGMLDKDG